MQPPRKTDPTNPFARRTPWGAAKPPPFRLGLGPASLGGVKRASGSAPPPDPAPDAAPAEEAPRLAPPPPKMGSGILGSSPLIPKAPRKVRPVATPSGAPIRTAGPSAGPVASRAADTPPAPPTDLGQLASRLQRPAAPVGRRLLIGAVALGVVALIAVAAVMLSERNARLEAATPLTTAVAPPDLAPSAEEAAAAARTAAEPVAVDAPIDALPSAPIYRAATPPAPSAGAASARPSPATSAPAVIAPVPPPPAAVELPPVVEAPPPPRPAPPPVYVRPPVDPDAPIVLRREDG